MNDPERMESLVRAADAWAELGHQPERTPEDAVPAPRQCMRRHDASVQHLPGTVGPCREFTPAPHEGPTSGAGSRSK